MIIPNSKHIVVGNEILLIKNEAEVSELKARRKKFTVENMISGKYTFIIKLFFIRALGLESNLVFKYKMGMHKGEKTLILKNPDQNAKYLRADLEYFSPDYLQLTLINSFKEKDIVICKSGKNSKRSILRPEEIQKIIVDAKSLSDFNLEYKIKDVEFVDNPCTLMIRKMLDKELNVSKLENVILDSDCISNNLCYTQTLLDENYIKICKFEIENDQNIKVYDQKYILFNYKLSNRIRYEGSKYYIEMKYPASKYSILGDVRFMINNFSDEDWELSGGNTVFTKLHFIQILSFNISIYFYKVQL